MTQTISYASMSKVDLIEIIERQKQRINELAWHDEIMSNTDLPIAARFAARAIRKFTQTREPCDDGYYKGYLPVMADLAGVSASTISRGLETLSDATEAIDKHTDELRDERGRLEKNLLYFRIHENFNAAAEIIPIKELPKHGGNRRLPCPECGCVHRRRKVIEECAACSHKFYENERIIRGDEESLQDATGESESEMSDASDDQESLQVATLPVDTGSLALQELKSRRIWTCMRLEPDEKTGKVSKVPYIADLPGEIRASSTKPSTWRTFEYVVACYEQSQTTDTPFDGIMFMCNETFTFIDQDHCRNKETGEITQEAMERARRINSYTEESFSGDGIHTYAWATIPRNRKRSDIGVEMYDHARPCVFTGKPLAEFPLTMEHRQEEIQAMHRELFPEPPKVERLWNAPSSDTTSSISDEDILKKASEAKNGAKFTALYGGDWSGYHSQSEADQALCRMLAYWTDNNVSTIIRLFEKSGLIRDKWERDDYREQTISKAIGQNWQVAS